MNIETDTMWAGELIRGIYCSICTIVWLNGAMVPAELEICTCQPGRGIRALVTDEPCWRSCIEWGRHRHSEELRRLIQGNVRNVYVVVEVDGEGVGDLEEGVAWLMRQRIEFVPISEEVVPYQLTWQKTAEADKVELGLYKDECIQMRCGRQLAESVKGWVIPNITYVGARIVSSEQT